MSFNRIKKCIVVFTVMLTTVLNTTTVPVNALANIEGAHFAVKLESEVQKVGWENAKSYDELVTDDKGYAKSIELPYGKYRVKETVVPATHSPVADFFVNITNISVLK